MITRKIWLPYGAGKRLREAMGVPQTTLNSALTYKSDSEQARAIRYQALKFYGGQEVVRSIKKF